MASRPQVLILPGLGNSGPDHWQSIWQALSPDYRRVDQKDWDHPCLAEWLAGLDTAVAAARGPVVLVAHSLACTLVAHWASRNPASRVVAALLVAPADVECPLHTPDEVRCFAPLPRAPLPFAATLVASRDDPFAAFERASEFAKWWGAELVDAGCCGHINADSQLDEWQEGRRLLEALIVRGDTVCAT